MVSAVDLFKDSVPYEVLVTTMDKSNRTNVSAMGVMKQQGIFLLRLFGGSNTFDNMKDLRMFGINVVHGIDLIAKATLKGWGNEEPEFTDDAFEEFGGYPFLKDATAFIECKVTDWQEQSGKDQFGPYHIAFVKATATNQNVTVPKEPMKRQDQPLVDALIMATRWKKAEGKAKANLEKVIRQLMEKSVANFDEKTFEAVGMLETYLAGKAKTMDEMLE